MNNFPFYQHHVIKIIFQESVKVDEELIDQTAKLLIETFKLNVVDEGKHKFPNNGFTKFWVLSQSHLVIHSWPENSALHIDLMTCSLPIINREEIEKNLSSPMIKEMTVSDLNY